jgi:hypothetical protein
LACPAFTARQVEPVQFAVFHGVVRGRPRQAAENLGPEFDALDVFMQPVYSVMKHAGNALSCRLHGGHCLCPRVTFASAMSDKSHTCNDVPDSQAAHACFLVELKSI